MSDETRVPEGVLGSPANFLEEIIEADIKSGRTQAVRTRFPPEPNGYLHIGHAKSICLNFGLAKKYGGTCNLRFDDTNPTTEEVEYVDSIKEDVRWLGFDWDDREHYASDYFDQLYEWAIVLIKKGLAYVDFQTPDEVARTRGNFYTKGQVSPHRDQSAEKTLALFEQMRAGAFDEGKVLLRARIDMAHPNMNMRDPILYRVRKAAHHRTGDKWVIYPIYDWAHGQSDAIEGISHSICTLEFDDHRVLYDWYLAALDLPNPPRQFEFARLNLTYTVMSKRKLLQLVKEGRVSGWDDPRMPTICGLRRRGCTPEAIRAFAERIGVAKNESTVDVGLLEWALREDLNARAPRLMAVLDPLKLVIEDLPEGHEEHFECPLFPDQPEQGTRPVPFGRELWIERDDFRDQAPKGWHRLAPGAEVRLRYAALVTLKEIVRDAAGQVVELRCTMDPGSRGGQSPDGRKVRGTIHWVSAARAVEVPVRLYDRLFTVEDPLDVPEGQDWLAHLNPDSLVEARAFVEPALAQVDPGARVQFERVGYFVADAGDSCPGAPVFNRTVTLKDSWAKVERRGVQLNAPTSAAAQIPAPTPAATPALAPAKATPAVDAKPTVAFDDFAKLDLRVGLVREAGLVEGADKLLRLRVDVGEAEPRQIFSGIRAYYPDPAVLVGRQVIVVANLAPRKMRFGVSEGMVLSGGGATSADPLAVATFLIDLRPGDPVS